MTRLRLIRLLGIVAALFIAPAPPAAADYLGQAVVADGVIIYLGVVPSSVLRDDSEHYGNHNKQCPVPGGRDNHHVMVALFDQATGERITDADVRARVSPLGLVGPSKHFAAIAVAGAVTYCNYFDMPATDRYDVTVEIRRPNTSGVIHASFTYGPCCR